jgi:hypothetical protein
VRILKCVVAFQVPNKSQCLESKSTAISKTWHEGRNKTTNSACALQTDGNSEKGNINVA